MDLLLAFMLSYTHCPGQKTQKLVDHYIVVTLHLQGQVSPKLAALASLPVLELQ